MVNKGAILAVGKDTKTCLRTQPSRMAITRQYGQFVSRSWLKALWGNDNGAAGHAMASLCSLRNAVFPFPAIAHAASQVPQELFAYFFPALPDLN